MKYPFPAFDSRIQGPKLARPRLLVSVRSAAEAVEALAGGADIIDVKEPLAGPLGAADWSTIEQVLDIVALRAPVSAALGELRLWTHLAPPACAERLAYVKLGLSQAVEFDWPGRFAAAMAMFPAHVGGVPVVYADAEIAGAPPLSEALHQARRLGCPLTLVDTFEKQSTGLAALWSDQRLREASAGAWALGMPLALAGKVQFDDLPRLVGASPEVIGVRGAACVGGRLGSVRRSLVRRLRDALERRWD